ncbi:SHOCT domain-containing protein [Candidatus Pelagibacter sp.]|nr:SHOCT domain-containing protein [Candidatus Pelagibacter sp.]
MNNLKKILWFLVIALLLNNNAFAKKYKTDDIVENKFYMSKKIILNLPKGKWTVVEKKRFEYYGLKSLEYTLVKTNDNKVTEAISIIEWNSAGVYESYVNHALVEIMFKGKYDGCYDRPEYTVMEFYKKGSTHNCFWVGHFDLIKNIYNPDDPELKTANTQLKMWLKEKKITLPKVALYSEHSYFSRLSRGKWYGLVYVVDPKILNAPNNNFIKEASSEYHKHNIDRYPEHKKIMKKWISISAQRHLDFENLVSAKEKHKLDLNNFSPIKDTVSQNQNDELIKQLRNLNDLFKNGVLTKEEFEKAKKKLLN